MPKTIQKDIRAKIESMQVISEESGEQIDYIAIITDLTAEMIKAAENLEFEQAASLRDRIRRLEKEYEQRNDS